MIDKKIGYELAKPVDYKKVNCGLYCAGTILTKDVVAERQGRIKKLRESIRMLKRIAREEGCEEDCLCVSCRAITILEEIMDFDEGKSFSVKPKTRGDGK